MSGADAASPAIVYTLEPEIDPTEVAGLFRRSGLRRPVDEPDRIARMVRHADLIHCARHDGVLVGIARSLTDFAFCCFLSDLAVDKSYQRQGIGRELVRRVREAVGPDCMLLLLSAPDAMPYYPHIGFQRVENGWTIPRER